MEIIGSANLSIQKHCFTKWVNCIFNKNLKPLINNIYDDFRDGSKLLDLLKILTKEDINSLNKDLPDQDLNKINCSLDIIKSYDIDFNDITSKKLLQGDHNAILNLLWKIIYYWQVKRIIKMDISNNQSESYLLSWCNEILKKYNLEVNNFDSDWKNGQAYNALLHSSNTKLFDFSKIKSMKPKDALSHAFKLAKTNYEIESILEPSDVDQKMPDSKCIFLYVVMIYEKLNKKIPPLLTSTPKAIVKNGDIAEYWEKLDEVTAWLEGAEKELGKNTTISDNIDGVKEQFNTHEGFITRLMSQQADVFNLLKKGKSMLEDRSINMDKETQRNMIDKMKRLNNMWETIRVNTLNFQSELQNSLNTLQKQQIEVFEKWLEDMEGLRIKDEASSSSSRLEDQMDPEEKKIIKERFETGTNLIKPLSNMLVVVDSEDDQEYKNLEEKLSSLQNRYLTLCQWLEKRYLHTLGPQLQAISQLMMTNTTLNQTPTGQLELDTTNQLEMREIGLKVDGLRDWNSGAISKLEKLLDYCLNPNDWSISDLPNFEGIKNEYENKVIEFGDLQNAYYEFSKTHKHDHDVGKNIENIERNLNYIKFKINKIDSLQTQKYNHPGPSPIFKKLKLDQIADYTGAPRPLSTMPPLPSTSKSPISNENIIKPSKSFEIEEKILTPRIPTEKMPLDKSDRQNLSITDKRAQFMNKIPSIEISKAPDVDQNLTADDDLIAKKDKATEDEILSEIPEYLAKKRESLSVPTEFPELDLAANEKQWEDHMNKPEKSPISALERLHINIYDMHEALKELETWFRNAREHPKFTSVSQTKEFSEAIENCSAKLDQIKALWPKIEENRNTARSISNSLDNKDETAVQISKDSGNLIHRWEGLFEQTNHYFETLVNMLEAHHYQSFQEPLASLNEWLEDVKTSLISDPNKYDEPEILKDKLKKTQEIQATIEAQSPNLTSIRSIWEDKSTADDASFRFSMRDKFQTDIDRVVAKYEGVKELAQEASKELDSRLALIKNYLEEVNVLKSWMMDLKRIMDTNDKFDTEPSSNKIKEEELKGLQENVDLLKPSLDNINLVTPKILENSDIKFAKRLRDEIQNLNVTWKHITTQADKDKSIFSYDEYNRYLDKIAKDLDSPRNVASEEDLKCQIQRLKNLKDDLSNKKTQFYASLPSGLYPQGAIPQEQEKELNGRFNSLMEKIIGLTDFYQTSQQDYNDFQDEITREIEKVQTLKMELEYFPFEGHKGEKRKSIISQLNEPSIKSLDEIPNMLKRRMSSLKEKARLLSKNKIIPANVEGRMADYSDLMKLVTPQIEERVKESRISPTNIKPHRKSPKGKSSKSQVETEGIVIDNQDANSRLDDDLLKLQEWIVHEDAMIMTHVDDEYKARDLSEPEYAGMIRDFVAKDELLERLEKDVRDMKDREKAGMLVRQLQVVKNRFNDLKANFENFEFPPELAPKLKRTRITLADLKGDIDEIKTDHTKPTDIKEQLDICLRDCYRLGELKNNTEELRKNIPEMVKEEKEDIKKQLDNKMEGFRNIFNEIADKANYKKTLLENSLKLAEDFQTHADPLTQWIDTTTNQVEERKSKFNVNQMGKEINWIEQIERECSEKEGSISSASTLLNSDKYRDLPSNVNIYQAELATIIHRLTELKHELADQKSYYKDMEIDYKNFKDGINKLKDWIDKAQPVIQDNIEDPAKSLEDKQKLAKTLSDLKNEAPGIRSTLSNAQVLGSSLVDKSDNFRMITLSELASCKKQLDELLPKLEQKLKSLVNYSPMILVPQPSLHDKRDKIETLPQTAHLRETKTETPDISFVIAKVNDLNQLLEPSHHQTQLPLTTPASDKELKNVLDKRIHALNKEYQDTETYIDKLKDKLKFGSKVEEKKDDVLSREYDQLKHKWDNEIQSKAINKIQEYQGLNDKWKSFVQDAQNTRKHLEESKDSVIEHEQGTMQDLKHLDDLKQDSKVFTKTELNPLAKELLDKIEKLNHRNKKTRKVPQVRVDSRHYPKTPPSSPTSLQKTVDSPFPSQSAPKLQQGLLTQASQKLPHPSASSGTEKSKLDRLEYSDEPYEFLWEIGNIQDMLAKMIAKLKDPVLFDDDLDQNGKNIEQKDMTEVEPKRRERLMSIKETIDAISPGIEGSENHKNEILYKLDDPSITHQIEDSMSKLKTDWKILNDTYKNRIDQMTPVYKSVLQTTPTSKSDSEPAEAIDLVNKLQSLAIWLRKCENLTEERVPFLNESALRISITTFKKEGAQFPAKLNVLKEAEKSLNELKSTADLSPEKADRIGQLISQAKEKYYAISSEFDNKRKETEDSYHRLFHFNQQIDDLGSWLSSTRKNTEKNLPRLKEDDINNLHAKLEEHTQDYDQLNYTFIQLLNEGSRYNSLYDSDEFSVPKGIIDNVKAINNDWDFLKGIEPLNIRKTVTGQLILDSEPNVQAKWPKVQQDLYEITDKLNTIENFLSSRIVDVINPYEINKEISDLTKFSNEVNNLKNHIDHITKLENNKMLNQAGYDNMQAKEADDKCQELLNGIKRKIRSLNQMSTDCDQYLKDYAELNQWIDINGTVLRELIDVKDKNHITEQEFIRNHEYLMKKVPTYGKLNKDLDTLAKKMITDYTDDDTSNLKAKHNEIHKLWYLVPLHPSPKGLLSSEPFTPTDIRQFSKQLSDFDVSLLTETSALDVMSTEIDNVLKDRDEEHLNVWLDQIKEFQRDLESHRVGYNILNENGKKILGDPTLFKNHEESMQLKSKLDDVNGKWENLKAKSNTLRNTLEEHYDPRNAISQSIDDASAWVQDRSNHLECMKPLGGDLTTLKHQLDQVQHFALKLDAKRNPSIQDVLKNSEAYLKNIGYYKALDMKDQSPPHIALRIKEGKELENKIVVLDQKWCDVIDNTNLWESTLAQMLGRMDHFNNAMIDLDISLNENRKDLENIDIKADIKDIDKSITKYNNLSKEINEKQAPLIAINAKASEFSAQGLQLSKDYQQRLEQLNDKFHILKRDLENRTQGRVIDESPNLPFDKAKQISIPVKAGTPLQPYISPPTSGPSKPDLESQATKYSQPKFTKEHEDTLPETSLTPRWAKAMTETGVPYYIDTKSESTYWAHPMMMEIMKNLTEVNYIKYSAYRTAMKLRIIQKRLFLYLLNLGTAIDIFDAHGLRGKNEDYIRMPEITQISKDIYKTLSSEHPHSVTNVPLSTDLYVDWLLDVYDPLRTGKIKILSLKVATVLLCRAHLSDKYRYLFQLIADQSGNASKEKVAILLKDMLLIPRYFGESSAFGGTDPIPSTDNCFQFSQSFRHQNSLPQHNSSDIRASEFIRWAQTDPQSIVWLPVLYRLAAAETARHQSKCNICKAYPIVGFRYRCLKCLNFDICQNCFFANKKYKTHKPTHPLHEYSTPTTTGEDVLDLTRALRNKLFRSRRYFVTHPRLGYTPIDSLQPIHTTSTGAHGKGGKRYPPDQPGGEESLPLMSSPYSHSGMDASYTSSDQGGRTKNMIQESSFGGENEEYRKVAKRGFTSKMNEMDICNLNDKVDEHELIGSMCKSLSAQPSPCVSTRSINGYEEAPENVANRTHDLHKEHNDLRREYERLRHRHYDQYSLNEEASESILLNHQFDDNILSEDSFAAPVFLGNGSHLNNHEHLLGKNCQNMNGNDTNQEFPMMDSSFNNKHQSSFPTQIGYLDKREVNPIFSVADNLNKALGDLVSVITSSHSHLKSPVKTPPAISPCR